ncbi:hypothetical protein AB0K25_19965 [Micromonospora sp. NPDC049257]|uniref:hypothetical protein n=1 Tax=Micromonospora sp. NPDC049257 TaxID=3155771 RepID=UPI00341CB2FC
MDFAWLTQLAATGGAALVQSAATDAWHSARLGFTRLLGRGDLKRETVARRRLDALAAEVERALPAHRDEVRCRLLPVWQTRLADLIEEDPAAGAAVRTLRDELLAALPTSQQQWVQQYVNATAAGATAQGVMFGNIINYSASSPAEPSGPGADEMPTRRA